MEFQQKGQQITLSQGVIFMKMGRRITMGKKCGGTDVYGESIYTKRGNYCAYELLLQKNVVFLYGPRPKLHLW
jgi:hypothetical protein